MRRRDFICLIGVTALSMPRLGYAQTKTNLPVVALLMVSKAATSKDRVDALRKDSQEEGFVDGTNYSLATRFAEGDFNRLRQFDNELGALNPSVFVTVGFGASPAQRSFPNIPLVFAAVAVAFWPIPGDHRRQP